MSENKDTDSTKTTIKSSSPWWVTVLKIIGWSIFGLILTVMLICTLIVWILNPSQLTPLVEEKASEYLDADVTASRVELTFWHSFPRMTLDVDSLTVVSRSLESLPDSIKTSLPADADTLLTVNRFHGGINIAALPLGKIALYDLIIERPEANLLQVDSIHANYLIVPVSHDDDSASKDSDSVIPQISINRFAIVDSGPIRYRSIADSTDVSITLTGIDLTGNKAPDYKLSVTADGRSPMLGMIPLDSLHITLDGGIKWSHQSPGEVDLKDFTFGLDSLSAEWNCALDFTDSLSVKSLDLKLKDWRAAYIISLLPESISQQFKDIKTDMTLNLSARLLKPYTLADSISIPSLHAVVEIPECKFIWDKLHFNSFKLCGEATVDGDNVDRSVIDVKQLTVDGKIIEIDFSGNVTTPVSDPCIDGRLKAGFDFSRLPRFAYRKIARVMGGRLSADVSLNMKQSYLSPSRFHRIKVKGDVDLDRFIFGSLDSVTNLFVSSSCLKFGTGQKYAQAGAHTIDSLLTVSLSVDSMRLSDGPIMFTGAGMEGGAGCRLTGFVPKDSTTVIPIGGHIKSRMLSLEDRTDSLRVRLTGVSCNALLKRFENDLHAPWLQLDINADRMMMRDTSIVIGLRENHFGVSAHLRKRRIRAVADSLGTTRRRIAANATVADDPAKLDIEVDSGLKTALQRWDVRGNIRSAGGGFFSRAIPVRNAVRNVDLTFSTDSIVLRDLFYRLGKSDFTVNGTVSNIRRALTRRRNNVLKINFEVESDTININEISRLAFTGGGSMDMSQISDDMAVNDDKEHTAAATDSAITEPFMIPSNIDADLDIKARNVLYTDMMFHDFAGCLRVKDKALTLNRLGASNEIGKVSLSALYSTPVPDSISFGLGMKVDNFHIEKVMKLIPAIDSLMPMLHDFSGIINADVAATSRIDRGMNLVIPSLKAAISLSGDSLVLLDADTFKSLSKWLMFKNKRHNMIDSMSVEMVVDNSQIEIFPFIFDIDRYRLGIMGSNDMNMNLNYHVSVLKSPFPFKFGINIRGNIDDMKIRLGGAKVKPGSGIERISIADTTRVNLVKQIENVFRRSAHSRITLDAPKIDRNIVTADDTISGTDSLLMIKEGLIEAPVLPDSVKTDARR